jgi:hypothetical protein
MSHDCCMAVLIYKDQKGNELYAPMRPGPEPVPNLTASGWRLFRLINIPLLSVSSQGQPYFPSWH